MSAERNSVIIVAGRGLPNDFDLREAQANWGKSRFELSVVDISGRRFYSNLDMVTRRVGEAVRNSSETLVVGVQEGGPYAVAMHTALRDVPKESDRSLTAVTLFTNFDLATAASYPEIESLRLLDRSIAVGTLGVNRANTINYRDKRNPKIQFIQGASVFPVTIENSLEDEITKAIMNRRGKITGRVIQHRMDLAQGRR